jgi:antitoxin VapB
MALSIKSNEADRLARELAAVTGESLTDAVIAALSERLRRERLAKKRASLLDEIMRIGAHCASLKVLDARSADAILGYDEHGLSS